ncbi:MAG TPA: hypothetical protein DCS07_17960 [Bdellovibrionales bacterium]|nr:MAG: hypothetical protein A2X97_10950 [Bdellovibrionales bacterium GWA1_52_35]OFZ43510.1 MAG: hypothetical protein A2070_14230 [Bdellovibrionales bacterium GWC1_52_8]HAR44487.1 hypothetical protein [Bdellovibrionales bacterium]HCM38564.1 hypothetical protein [Bdellovibrionales bacterium]
MKSSSITWDLEQLKRALSAKPEVKGWIITQENLRRRERYFMLDDGSFVVDQDRDVQTQTVWARVFVKSTKAGRQGEITKKLFKALPLNAQLDSAIASALDTDHQAWELPKELPTSRDNLKTADPRIAEDISGAMEILTGKVANLVGQRRATAFSSAELFLSVHNREVHLSNGLVNRSAQSRIYSEAAYSFSRILPSGEVQSDEYLNMRWSVNLDDLQVDELFLSASDRAEHSLEVTKPDSSKYPVIVDADVLAELFNGYVAQLSAGNSYHGLPFIKKGDELIPGARGDLITLTLDPWLDYGADTINVSEQGVTQAPLKLVDDNRVVATATEKQYSDYLNQAVTTSRGNIVINAGTLSHEQLTASAPKVIEILQFSGLFADPNSGTFSSEIRLARLYDNVNHTIKYLKGGSLSGSIVENFSNARLCKSRVKRAHFASGQIAGHGYFGPSHALLNDVSIVG